MSELRERLVEAEKQRDEALAAMASKAPINMRRVWARMCDMAVADRVAAIARAEAAEGLIEQAVRALERIEGTAKPTGGHGAGKWHNICIEIASSTLSLLKASRPQNREETDAENERIS